jgi:hypothetical protein
LFTELVSNAFLRVGLPTASPLAGPAAAASLAAARCWASFGNGLALTAAAATAAAGVGCYLAPAIVL